MHKYEVTWILPDSTTTTREFQADGYQVLPNGIVAFVRERKTTQLHLVQGQTEAQYDMLASVAGYSSIVEI